MPTKLQQLQERKKTGGYGIMENYYYLSNLVGLHFLYLYLPCFLTYN